MKRMKQKNHNTSLNDNTPFSNDGQSFFEWPPPPQHWHTNVGQFEVLCSAIFWQRLHSNKSIAYDLVISSPVNDCSPYFLAFDLDLLEYWKESKVAVTIFWHFLNFLQYVIRWTFWPFHALNFLFNFYDFHRSENLAKMKRVKIGRKWTRLRFLSVLWIFHWSENLSWKWNGANRAESN